MPGEIHIFHTFLKTRTSLMVQFHLRKVIDSRTKKRVFARGHRIFSLECGRGRTKRTTMSIMRTSRVFSFESLCFPPALVLSVSLACHSNRWATTQSMQPGSKCKLSLGSGIAEPWRVDLPCYLWLQRFLPYAKTAIHDADSIAMDALVNRSDDLSNVAKDSRITFYCLLCCHWPKDTCKGRHPLQRWPPQTTVVRRLRLRTRILRHRSCISPQVLRRYGRLALHLPPNIH